MSKRISSGLVLAVMMALLSSSCLLQVLGERGGKGADLSSKRRQHVQKLPQGDVSSSSSSVGQQSSYGEIQQETKIFSKQRRELKSLIQSLAGGGGSSSSSSSKESSKGLPLASKSPTPSPTQAPTSSPTSLTDDDIRANILGGSDATPAPTPPVALPVDESIEIQTESVGKKTYDWSPVIYGSVAGGVLIMVLSAVGVVVRIMRVPTPLTPSIAGPAPSENGVREEEEEETQEEHDERIASMAASLRQKW